MINSSVVFISSIFKGLFEISAKTEDRRDPYTHENGNIVVLEEEPEGHGQQERQKCCTKNKIIGWFHVWIFG